MFWCLISLLFLPLIYADCPDGTIQYPFVPPSKCYLFNTIKAPFDAAESACNKAGGNLASIHDAFANAFLKEEASLLFHDNATTDFWIGAKRLDNNSSWFWTDKTKFDFTDWINSGANNNQNFVAMNTSSGLWSASDGTLLKPYVCETDNNSTILSTTTTKPASNCSDEWYYFEETNSCYYWTDYFAWGKAEEYCVNQSAHLASIHSQSEYYFVQSIYNGNLWIGLYAKTIPVNENTTWMWTDYSTVDYLIWFFPFIPAFNDWKCVQMQANASNSNAGFANANCTVKNYAICKKPAATIITTSAPVTTTTKGGPCFAGWKYYNGTDSCYVFTPLVNWTTAEQFCVYNSDRRGHLTSIHSSDEGIWITNNLYASGNNPFWIGLYSDSSALVWKYTDGSAFDYRNWANNNPTRGGNPCAYFYRGDKHFYNTQGCDVKSIGVCKMPALSQK